jgi:hypothetical protein
MFNRYEGLTTQDHENQEWRPWEVILGGIAIIVVAILIGLCCAGLSVPRGYPHLPGF